MKVHRWSDVRKKHLSAREIAANRAWAKRELLDMDLRAVRELAGKTQVDVAKATKMAQSDVSKAEHREDHRLSTLRRYIEALGGELEVVARFGNRRVRLRGV
jgi:hypothetical protein